MNVPEFIKRIDWSELRNQKGVLLIIIDELEKKKDIRFEELDGILNLIDAIQDYAVDDAKIIDGIHVYDFEQEEERDASTPEEIFARTNADIIFQMHIEGTVLFDEESNGGMPREFIEKIVDDSLHASLIKNLIRLDILNDLRVNPDNFDRDANGKLTYDATMYDYGFAIEEYCKSKFNENEIQSLWVCSNCGSKNIEIKKWVNPNTNEVGTDCEDEYCWCPDCEGHHEAELKTFDLNGKEVEIGTTDGHIDPKNQ
jgi:hypothetical protein